MKSRKSASSVRHRARPDHSANSKPDFSLVARYILAAYIAAPSSRTTIAEMTSIAVELMMEKGYRREQVEGAIADLAHQNESRLH